MTLDEMATLVSTELGVYDDTSVDLIRAYLSKSYVNIWDKYAWKDTQTTAEITVTAGESTVDYPTGIDRMITVRATNFIAGSGPVSYRSDARLLEPVTSTFLIETDPNIFERTGYAIYYEEDTDVTTGTKRLRLFPTPVLETNLFVIAKAQCPGLTEDDHASIIRNIDVALIAYATASMLRRQRQFGKAEIQDKKGAEAEAVAWNLEQQQANLPRRTKATTVAGNSLAEMTDAVCAICGQWTPDYRLVIREFLRRNYQTMYDTFLGPESLVVVRVAYTTEQVVMPHYVDKVLGIRGTTNTRLFPADAGLFLDISPSIFEEIGDPIGYTTLTPVGVSTLPPETTGLVFASTSTIDSSPVFIRGEVIGTGQEIEETVILDGTTPVQTTYAYDIPITVSKEITVGDVTVNAATDYRSLEILPSHKRELKHQRMWLLPNPNTDSLTEGDTFTCIVLGKRAICPLLTDQDTPIITGAQQVLIAAAAADLFRKLEKHDLATAMLQKADGSMNVLKAKNTDQAAHAPRFVPQIEPRAYVSGGVGGCSW